MTDRPNILFLIADDHRHDVLGVAGHREIRTPQLDRLAAAGTRFTHHHCQGGMTGAICAPSRASIMSGRELFSATASVTPGDAGTTELVPDVPTFPETLRGNGYHTHAVGKWHNGTASFHRSFDSGEALFFGGMSDHDAVPIHDFDPTGSYPADAARPADGFSTDVFADATIDFLTHRPDDQPFFCWVAFTAPHDPRTPPADFAELYDADQVELPVNFRTDPVDTGDLGVRDEQLAAFPRDPAEIRRHLADYYGMISHLDDRIGTILRALDEAGLAENTIVIYTADHGLAVGQHGLMGKQNLFDHSVRVPLIMSGPGIEAGGTATGLSVHADLFPIMADLISSPVPDTVQGQTQPRTQVCAAYLNLIRMITDGRHKLIRYSGDQPRSALYDLVADPDETTDLSSDPGQAELMAELGTLLEDWQRRSGDPLRS